MSGLFVFFCVNVADHLYENLSITCQIVLSAFFSAHFLYRKFHKPKIKEVMSSENKVIEYNEKQKIVLQWIQSGCNFEQGAILYSQFGKNNFLKKDFPGKQHKHATKIIYELCKAVGLDYAKLQRKKLIPEFEEKLAEKKPIKKLPSINTTVPEVLVSEVVKDVKGIPKVLEVKNIAEYPLILRRIISEYSELFQERSKMHRIMTEMPEGNSQSLKTKRAEIFDIIKSLSA